VNLVTAELFKKYRCASDFAVADISDLENDIRSTGFYKNKAKNIKAACAALVAKFGGEVPRTMDELHALAGVGRKTANVVLNTAFGQPAISVDTHIFRVANRTGLAPGKTVGIVEAKLMKFVPPEFLRDAHHWLVLHGRYVCKARTPACPTCVIADLCEYRHKTKTVPA
jgi:endonuclease-3